MAAAVVGGSLQKGGSVFIPMLAILFAVLCPTIVTGQLGGYLPPVKDDVKCYPSTRTTFVQQYQTTTVVQPFTRFNTQTRTMQMLATATMAVTTTMQRVVQQQMQVPVFSTFAVTMTSIRTQVQQVPFQPPDVTSVFTSTRFQVQTSVNQQFVTRTQTSIRPVRVTRTSFNTQFSTSVFAQTQVQTSQVRGRDEERTVTRTQEAIRTQQIPQPAFTSQVQTVVVQTSQNVQFVTPRPVTRTQFAQSTRINTAFQQVIRTQQAVATQQVVRTQRVQVTRTQFVTSTSVQVRQQLVIRTQYRDRVVTRTQVIPQVVTSTSIIQQVNTQTQFQTVTSTLFQTQTVQGRPDIREQTITSFRNDVQTVTRQQFAEPLTVTQTVTRPCQQQVVQQTGYNYNQPRAAFNPFG